MEPFGVGDWQWALSIAGRFEGISNTSSSGSNSSFVDSAAAAVTVSQLRVAQEIVSEFREQLEQGQTAENTIAASNSNTTSSFTASDRALEAARLCEDYCGDVEGAVGILVLAHCWRRAQQIAARVHRADLLEEILTAARSACGELQQSLASHRRVIPTPTDSMIIDAVCYALRHALRAKEKLREVWKEPAVRLQQVTAADSDLQTLLAPSEEKDWSDTASEYSAVSFRSERSERSVGSGLSSVSVLSTASRSSTSSTYSSKSSVFSIEGLDHTLLSRGVAGTGQVGKDKRGKKEKDNPRRQKRKEKSRIKTAGSGRDVCGLRSEGDYCNILFAAAVAGDQAAAEAAELLPLLQLGYGGLPDKMDAVALQRAVGEYLDLLKSLGDVGPAPAYPPSWLEKKALDAIKYFQPERGPTSDPRVPNAGQTWQQFVTGLEKKWLHIQKSTLHYV
eukprot:gene32397-41971_t